MPRSSKYRYKRIVPARKWSYTTGQQYVSLNGCGPEHWSSTSTPLIRAPTRISSTAGPVAAGLTEFTVKDIECHISMNSITYSAIYITVAIVFTPENVVVDYENQAFQQLDDKAVFYNHPEWVLGYRTFQFDSYSQGNEWVVRSRIKKRLNGGDNIQLVVTVINHAEDPANNFAGKICYCNYSYKITN